MHQVVRNLDCHPGFHHVRGPKMAVNPVSYHDQICALERCYRYSCDNMRGRETRDRGNNSEYIIKI